MKPTVDGLLKAGYPVERVNMDQNRPLAAKYGVGGVPCFVMVQQGRETDRVIGQTSYSRLEAMFHCGATCVVRRIRPGGTNGRKGIGRPLFGSSVRTTSHMRSIGSGTLVKWKGRLVILTARHVVEDARRFWCGFSTGKTHTARVLSADATWDVPCWMTDAPPEGVEPAELELGEEAMQRKATGWNRAAMGPTESWPATAGCFSAIGGRARPARAGRLDGHFRPRPARRLGRTGVQPPRPSWSACCGEPTGRKSFASRPAGFMFCWTRP